MSDSLRPPSAPIGPPPQPSAACGWVSSVGTGLPPQTPPDFYSSKVMVVGWCRSRSHTPEGVGGCTVDGPCVWKTWRANGGRHRVGSRPQTTAKLTPMSGTSTRPGCTRLQHQCEDTEAQWDPSDCCLEELHLYVLRCML